MNQEKYRRLISGKGGNLGAVLLCFLLGTAAQIYSIVVGLRNFLYSKKWLKIHRVNATVISIGNITVGGTGKTPLVIWLCRYLHEKNIPCAILTRGYKTAKDSKLKTQNYSDEPAILAKACPDAKIVINPDRVAAAAEAVAEFGPKVLIADDAFQHRRLARDLDIVTIDATCPFGYDKILPAGLLREPVTALNRANAVVITRCDQLDRTAVSELERKLKAVKPDMVIATSIHLPVDAKLPDNHQIPISQLTQKKIFAFCGIGNPDAFLSTLKKLGLDCLNCMIFNDHHQYTHFCLNDICRQAQDCGADLLLTTEKDYTKVSHLLEKEALEPPLSLAYLVVELKFLAGQDQLKQLIEQTIKDKISKN